MNLELWIFAVGAAATLASGVTGAILRHLRQQRQSKEASSMATLRKHSLLTALQRLSFLKAPALEPGTVREYMARRFLSLYVQELRRRLLNFLAAFEVRDEEALPEAWLEAHLMEVVEASAAAVRESALKDGMPGLFIDKLEETTRVALHVLSNSIGSVCSARIYDDDYEKVVAAFNCMQAFVEAISSDVPAVARRLNGELNDFSYHGVSLAPSSPEQ